MWNPELGPSPAEERMIERAEQGLCICGMARAIDVNGNWVRGAELLADEPINIDPACDVHGYLLAFEPEAVCA